MLGSPVGFDVSWRATIQIMVIVKRIWRQIDEYQVYEVQFFNGVANKETVSGFVSVPLPSGLITSTPMAQQQQSR